MGKYAIHRGWDDREVREVLVLQTRGPNLDPQNPLKHLGVVTHNFSVGEVKAGRSLELTSQPT